MRHIFLAFLLMFSLGNALPEDLDDAISSLVDDGRDAEAFQVAREGAESGDPKSNEWLGWLYENGRGTDQDLERAAYHYGIAVESGLNYARWRMGVMIDEGNAPGRLEDAVSLFELAANDDFTNAMTSLAVMQATGRGTPVDYEASLTNYMRAARAGNAHGVQGVGVLFALGQGVPRDNLEAAAWFLVAAALGNEQGEANFNAVAANLNQVEIEAIAERSREIADGFDANVQIHFDPDEAGGKRAKAF